MSLEAYKELSRRAIQLWNSKSPDRPEDLVSEHYVNHQQPDVEGGIRARNLEEWKELINGFHSAWSSAKLRVTRQIAEENLVATQWEMTATDTGGYMGSPPTQQELTWTGVVIDRFENGQIVESWVHWDKYGLFKGLGLVK